MLKALDYDSLESLDELPTSVAYLMQKIQKLSAAEAVHILVEFLEEHEVEVKIPSDELDYIHRLVLHGGTNVSTETRPTIILNME